MSMHSISSKDNSAREHLAAGIGIGALIIVLFGVMATHFYIGGRSLMEDQLKQRLQNIAAAAAMQFEGENIESIEDGVTIETSRNLREIAERLHRIKEEVPDIRFAYIMRKSNVDHHLKFVADADLVATKEELDKNKNNTIDEDEKPAITGELYDTRAFPSMQEKAFTMPIADNDFATDQWGTVISGYAPIRKSDGTVVAIVGIDMSAEEFLEKSESLFSPLVFFAVLFCSIGIALYAIYTVWKWWRRDMVRLENERSGLLRLAFHQLGGPLSIINWSIEELEEKDRTPAIERVITNIKIGVERLDGIFKMLKDADMVHAHTVLYHPSRTSLSSLVTKCVKQLGRTLALRRQRIELILDDTLTIPLDEKLIETVITELCMNAIYFSSEGGVITVLTKRMNDHCTITISDHGCGIPTADMHRLFEQFTRGSNATKYRADGNGLGLYIAKGIVESAKGMISLQSSEGEGTTVTVTIPILKNEETGKG